MLRARPVRACVGQEDGVTGRQEIRGKTHNAKPIIRYAMQKDDHVLLVFSRPDEPAAQGGAISRANFGIFHRGAVIAGHSLTNSAFAFQGTVWGMYRNFAENRTA